MNNNSILLAVLAVATVIFMLGTAMSNSPMTKLDKYIYANTPDVAVMLEKSCQPSSASTSLWDCDAKVKLKNGSTVKLRVRCPGTFSTNTCVER